MGQVSGLSYLVFCSELHQDEIEVLSGAEISSEAQFFLFSSLVVRRFQFLAVVGLRLSGLKGHHLLLVLSTVSFFKAKRRRSAAASLPRERAKPLFKLFLLIE